MSDTPHPLDNLRGLPRRGLDWCDRCTITVEGTHICCGWADCPRMKAREDAMKEEGKS